VEPATAERQPYPRAARAQPLRETYGTGIRFMGTSCKQPVLASGRATPGRRVRLAR